MLVPAWSESQYVSKYESLFFSAPEYISNRCLIKIKNCITENSVTPSWPYWQINSLNNSYKILLQCPVVLIDFLVFIFCRDNAAFALYRWLRGYCCACISRSYITTENHSGSIYLQRGTICLLWLDHWSVIGFFPQISIKRIASSGLWYCYVAFHRPFFLRVYSNIRTVFIGFKWNVSLFLCKSVFHLSPYSVVFRVKGS